MGLNIYFLRHGETTFSRSGGFCGELDIELTDVGKEMAEAFAKAYRTFPWTAIYSSPKQRAVHTARPICEAVGMDMHIREGLKEIAYGKWEGLTPEEVSLSYHDDYIRYLADPGWNGPTEGERAVDIARRSVVVLNEIEQNHASGNVLVVSHKATIRIMLCELLGIDIGRYRDRLVAPVASLSRVEFGVHGPLLHLLGDRSHFPQHLRDLPGS
ncbi:MAG TPA: histidine phosphatase family protein [Coleofasciculaceae cyanobacterium]